MLDRWVRAVKGAYDGIGATVTSVAFCVYALGRARSLSPAMTAKTNAATQRAKPAVENPFGPNVSSWVEVSRRALVNNLHAIQSRVGPDAIVCPVIKSDAYGHGATGCALALCDAGAKWLAVSTVEEGVTVRQMGIQSRILVLSGFWSGEEDEVVAHQLTPAVWEREHLALLEKEAQRKALGPSIPVHLKTNTGMNRLGADQKDLPAIYAALRASPHVSLEGIFSHFAASEAVDDPYGDEQLRRFTEVVAETNQRNVHPSICHMANSAAIAGRPASWFNFVRPGLAIYGYCLPLTSQRDAQANIPEDLLLEPALTWKTRVLQVREVAAGQQVGYSGGFVARSATKVAVLAVGYGDGLSRKLSSRGRMIVRDAYAPILGNVSMNLTAVDVTKISGVTVGDEVTIIGPTPTCNISPWEHANLTGTIPYEIFCSISGRLTRKYVD